MSAARWYNSYTIVSSLWLCKVDDLDNKKDLDKVYYFDNVYDLHKVTKKVISYDLDEAYDFNKLYDLYKVYDLGLKFTILTL